MKLFAIGLSVLVLASCTERYMNEGLYDLAGQNIQVAIKKLGYPDAETTIMGEKVYVWSTQHMTSLPSLSLGSSVGVEGGKPVAESTNQIISSPAEMYCTIRLVVENNMVKRTMWQGNMGGCAVYARALRRP